MVAIATWHDAVRFTKHGLMEKRYGRSYFRHDDAITCVVLIDWWVYDKNIKQYLQPVIDSLILRHPNIHFYVHGSGAVADMFRNKSSEQTTYFTWETVDWGNLVLDLKFRRCHYAFILNSDSGDVSLFAQKWAKYGMYDRVETNEELETFYLDKMEKHIHGNQ